MSTPLNRSPYTKELKDLVQMARSIQVPKKTVSDQSTQTQTPVLSKEFFDQSTQTPELPNSQSQETYRLQKENADLREQLKIIEQNQKKTSKGFLQTALTIKDLISTHTISLTLLSLAAMSSYAVSLYLI